jgi:hypothetical protein
MGHKQQLVNEIFRPNENGESEWIDRETIDESDLKWGNNGLMRHDIAFGDNRLIWEAKRAKGPQSKITALRTNGFSDSYLYGASRPIRRNIDKQIKNNGVCVHCGSKSNLVTDHKNDLYNDPRVLNTYTQTIDDFQCLCNACNLRKRSVAKKTRETGKRIKATTIPTLAVFGIDFIEGGETYNPEDINAMKGTYWYDPVEFMRKVKDSITR